MTCQNIDSCNKLKTHDFFRLTCMDDHEFCHLFDSAIGLGNENRLPRNWVDNPPKKWWLICDDDVQTLKAGLMGSLLHTLETGLHITNAIPSDYQSSTQQRGNKMKIDLSEVQMRGIIRAAEVHFSEGLGTQEFSDLALSVYQCLYPSEKKPWWYRGSAPSANEVKE